MGILCCICHPTYIQPAPWHFCISRGGPPWPLPGPSRGAAFLGILPLAHFTLSSPRVCLVDRWAAPASSSWPALPGCPVSSSNRTPPKRNSPQVSISGIAPPAPPSFLAENPHSHDTFLPAFTAHLSSPRLAFPSPAPHFPSLASTPGIWGGLPRVTLSPSFPSATYTRSSLTQASRALAPWSPAACHCVPPTAFWPHLIATVL